MSSASIAIAAARTPYDSDRRTRSAVGATAGRIHRAGTSRNAGHRRRAQATIRSSSRPSIAAPSPLDIARGYVRAPPNGESCKAPPTTPRIKRGLRTGPAAHTVFRHAPQPSSATARRTRRRVATRGPHGCAGAAPPGSEARSATSADRTDPPRPTRQRSSSGRPLVSSTSSVSTCAPGRRPLRVARFGSDPSDRRVGRSAHGAPLGAMRTRR